MLLALRRASSVPHWSSLSTRSTASLQSNLQSKPNPAVTAPQKRKGNSTRRSNISLASPKDWNRPIREGCMPVYDEALKVIYENSRTLKLQIRDIEDSIVAMEKLPEGELDKAKLSALKDNLDILHVQSQINLPSVRWKFANGMGDLSKPIYRHLAVQKWRNMGTLDLLMERIHQMNVVPDLLPTLNPSFDLRITFPEARVSSRYPARRRFKDVEPGTFLLPEQTRRPPRLYTSVFHLDVRYYTMLMVDPDVPNPEDSGFTTYLHWMQPNIPLSASSCSPLPAYPHTRYIPPHPQCGTPYHRYTLLFLPNPKPSEKLDIPVFSDEERRGFNLREFCQLYGFDSAQGGAVHMWREVWNETVSHIYTHTLKSPEPQYGLPPFFSAYQELKQSKKYSV